ncbi:MAG: amidohydrolase family protein [Acidimicrobiales bacterium]
MAEDRPGQDHLRWVNQVQEEPLEPALAICDPHHHLWLDSGHTGWPYTIDDLLADTGAGHNIVQTVYLECGAEYREDGPRHLRPVGEIEFVIEQAERSSALAAEQGSGAVIAGIQGNADMTLGDAVEEVLLAHEEAGRGRFRGVRYITAQNDHPPLAMRASAAMDDPQYLAGVKKVGAMGYTYDAMAYHPQLPDLAAVARTCGDTPIVINHLGGFLGTGPYKNRRDEIIATWKQSMTELAACENTYLKVGGIGMPMMGFRWDKQDVPPTSAELAEPWAGPIQWVIDEFGPGRCMFESNFPVDRRGAGYVVLWNAFKRIAADYSDDEKRLLFHDTAAAAYRLETLGQPPT